MTILIIHIIYLHARSRYIDHILNMYKVNRCLARYSPRATTTNQPTNRAPNEPARPGKNANFGLKGLTLVQALWGQEIGLF